MNALVEDAIKESISGIISEHRPQSRADGTIGEVLVRYPTSRLLYRVNNRINRMQLNFPELDIQTLNVVELTNYLPKLCVSVLGDNIELQVIIPPPRAAHAR
jgi:hypothetical protein